MGYELAVWRGMHKKIGKHMTRLVNRLLLVAVLVLSATHVRAEPLEYIGKPVRGIPVSQAVKVAKFVFVSGTPAFDGSGKLAVGCRTVEACWRGHPICPWPL